MQSPSNINIHAIYLGFLTLIGLVFAVVAGDLVATGKFQPLIAIGAITIAAIIAILTGPNYWILVPLTFTATGSAGALPLPFSYAEMGVLAAFLLFLFHLTFKKIKWSFGNPKTVDFYVALNIGYLLSVFIRNPVGVNALHSELVGGRPYISILLALVGYYILSMSRLNVNQSRMFTIAFIICTILPGSLIVLSEFVPGSSKILYPFYSSVNVEVFRVTPIDPTAQSERITSLSQITKPTVQALCAYFPPATLINPMYPWRFTLFITCLIMTGLSGFRNHILAIGAFLSISSYLRRQYAGWIAVFVAAIFAVIIAASLQQAGFKLPFAVQRSLSFLPLDWDAKAVADAEGTVEWRVDMWKAAWESPIYMRNKVLGDGFGFTRLEMMIMSDMELGIGKILGTQDTFEGHLIRGSFHNGPLSAIKFVGFVGLLFFTLYMIVLAAYAFRVVKNAEGTPFYVLALFIALPVIYLPIEYYFIFGAYSNALILCLFSTGMLKLIDASINVSVRKLS
jgi:hypothetical protein